MDYRQQRIRDSLIAREDTRIEVKGKIYQIKLKMLGGLVIHRSYSFRNRKEALSEGSRHLNDIRNSLDISDINFRDQLKFLEWYIKTHSIE